MGRKSLRTERRADIIRAFAKVLANHGYAGATMTAVADAAGISAGLLHHHFSNKQEMLDTLLTDLIAGFRSRLAAKQVNLSADGAATEDQKIGSYMDAALKLDQHADAMAAKCWVGILSEALRDPALFDRIRRYLDKEIEMIQQLSSGKLDTQQSSALLAYVFGSLIFGAFAPKKTAGFAAENGRLFAEMLVRSLDQR